MSLATKMISIPTSPLLLDFADSLKNGSYKCAVFDFDGVIANSLQLHFDAWLTTFRQHGIQSLSDDEIISQVNGIPAESGSLRVLRKAKETCELYADTPQFVYPHKQTSMFMQLSSSQKARILEAEVLAKNKRETYISLVENTSSLTTLPGVSDFLEWLDGHNVALALATSSQEGEYLLNKLGLDHFFRADLRVTAATVGTYSSHLQRDLRGKPSPDPFLEPVYKLGLQPFQAFGIEDSPHGIDAIKAGGLFALGIDGASPGSLPHADLCIEYFPLLLQHLG